MNRGVFYVWLCALLSMSELAVAVGENILFVTGRHSNKAKINLLQEYGAEHKFIIERISQSQIQEAAGTFEAYDLVVFEAASLRESREIYPQYASLVAKGDTQFLAIKDWENVPLRKGLTEAQARRLHDYYDNGGKQNLQHLMDYLEVSVFGHGVKEIPEAIIYPEIGLYHPESKKLVFDTLSDYQSWQSSRISFSPESKIVVGLLLQRALIESVQTDVIDAAIEGLESEGVQVVPFFFELSPSVSDYRELIQRNGETQVDIILNFRSIHWASQREKEFKQFGVPVMQALTYYDGDQKTWEQDRQGISPGMMPFTLTLPESAGVVDPMIVAAVDEQSGESQVIDYQLQHFLNKAIKVSSLKHKANADKKLTIMTWGDTEVGASFLNVPESLASITKRLNQESYSVDVLEGDGYTKHIDRILNPFYLDYELDLLLDDDLADLMPIENYLAWFNTLPNSVTQPINQYWGDPKDNFMVVFREGKHQFVLPRIRNGNLLIMRQPPRSDDKEQDQRIFHKGDIPMNHYYLAAYYYAREYWSSDAIIHLGTHGSQEYLGGKERGLSIFDEGNLAVWDTPILYPFIVDDVGEAMQTKRRGRATVFAHMTPPFAAAGLQGELSALHELMHQYKSLDEGGVKEKTGQQLVDDCIATRVCSDFGWSEEKIAEDFSGFQDELHDYMTELASANQPLGLHTYGELPERELLISTLVQMLGAEFAELAATFEAELHGHSSGDHHGDHGKGSAEALHDRLLSDDGELQDNPGYQTLEKYVLGAFNEQGRLLNDEIINALDEPLDEALIPYILKGREQYKQFTSIKEMDHLVAGLSGKYIPVKNGGDPIRHPEAVPTGFNLYGFDPSRVPTKAAYKQGKELTESVIANYYNEHGRYPDKLAFSLWSIETMRHYGVLEAQALYAMGVKPKWSADGRVVGTEIIPFKELGRPRVDVVLSATGLYRDAFPNVMQLLARAIENVSELAEESNAVWRNSQRIESELLAEGVAADEASYLSTIRLFSSEPGSYSSGVDEAVFASDSWENDQKIAGNYLSKMGYFFGSHNLRWGEGNESIGLYARQLSGTDIAIMSRSSNLFGMISSDDPFEYFGALSLAVRNIDGASPEMLISNLREADNPKAQEAAQFLATELRTRNFNKRWLKEMMKEGYSGATTLSSNLANFWGWQVVDPDVVRGDQWQTFFEVYVEDSLQLGVNEWFEQVNPASQAQMLETMLESVRKDYWQADEETLKAMLERFVDLVEKHDLFVDNQKLQDFVDGKAAGFGLKPLSSVLEVAAAQAATGNEVQGQKLEQVQKPDATQPEWDLALLSLFSVCLFIFALGSIRQFTRPAVA